MKQEFHGKADFLAKTLNRLGARSRDGVLSSLVVLPLPPEAKTSIDTQKHVLRLDYSRDADGNPFERAGESAESIKRMASELNLRLVVEVKKTRGLFWLNPAAHVLVSHLQDINEDEGPEPDFLRVLHSKISRH